MNQPIIIHLYLHDPRMDEVIQTLRSMSQKQELEMAAIDDLIADAQDESTVDDSIIALLNSISANSPRRAMTRRSWHNSRRSSTRTRRRSAPLLPPTRPLRRRPHNDPPSLPRAAYREPARGF